MILQSAQNLVGRFRKRIMYETVTFSKHCGAESAKHKWWREVARSRGKRSRIPWSWTNPNGLNAQVQRLGRGAGGTISGGGTQVFRSRRRHRRSQKGKLPIRYARERCGSGKNSGRMSRAEKNRTGAPHEQQRSEEAPARLRIKEPRILNGPIPDSQGFHLVRRRRPKLISINYKPQHKSKECIPIVQQSGEGSIGLL